VLLVCILQEVDIIKRCQEKMRNTVDKANTQLGYVLNLYLSEKHSKVFCPCFVNFIQWPYYGIEIREIWCQVISCVVVIYSLFAFAFYNYYYLMSQITLQ